MRPPDHTFLDTFAEFGPISRSLSMLIRPTFIAAPGKVLVWGDWAAIEARVLPWLAQDPDAEKVLDIFRTNDADPDAPDIYVIQGEQLQIDAEPKVRRQTGKVAVLSLGFGGAVGALQNMATNYGIYLDDALARRIVDTWRANNPWARALWDALWEAALAAMQDPDTIYPVGRVAYVYDKSYLGGTLFCGLPCGRLLTYPAIRWEKREKEIDGKVVERTELTCLRGYGRTGLWYGKLAENVTQATAASILRRSLRLLDDSDSVIGHTHDEILLEVDEAMETEARRELNSVMLSADAWMDGLPLAVELFSNWYYTKAGD